MRCCAPSPTRGRCGRLLSIAQLGQGKDALAALRRAAELLPEDPEAHGNLGGVLSARGDWEAALVSLRRSLSLQPRNPQALIDAGDVQRAVGRPREAINLYQWALQIEPQRREALNNLGSAFLDLPRAGAGGRLLPAGARAQAR